MNSPQMRDDEIGRKLAEAERNGELRSAKGYGQPLAEDAGWAQTPDALRMPFKILKDAGVMPPEIELMHRRAALRQQMQDEPDPLRKAALGVTLSALEQSISLRLEAVRGRG